MWILILIVLAVVVYFVVSQESSSNQASRGSRRTQASKASSLDYINQVDYSNLEVSLVSSVSCHYNYTHLRDLLAEGKWKEADKETGRLMLAVGNITVDKKVRAGEWTHCDPRLDCLHFLHFMYFPCADLCTIDRLWLKYSNGRFGFSVQKRIMSELGEDTISLLCKFNKSYEEFHKKMELENSFERRIGWRKNDSAGRSTANLKTYNDLTFSMQAPHGHLPTANYWNDSIWIDLPDVMPFETKPLKGGCGELVYILNRLSSCGIAL